MVSREKTKEKIKATLRSLFQRRARAFLTLLGIGIGVAGVIVIVSLGAGAQTLVLGQITKLGSNLIAILPGKSDSSGPPAAIYGVTITSMTQSDVTALSDKARNPYLTNVAASVRGVVTVVAGNSNVDTYVTGANASYPNVQNVPLLEGRFFSEAEDNSNANVAVLGYSVKQSIFADKSAIGEVIKLTATTADGTVSIPFRVVGVAAEQGNVFFQNEDDQVFVPLNVAAKQILGINYVQYIRAKADSAEHIKTAIADATRTLREEHHIAAGADDDFSVRDLADAIKILTSITDALKSFLGLMAGLALVVGGIGIMNIMLITVTERTQEIGLRKSIGATAKDIQSQFLLEAVTLTAVGGILGILAGIIISYLIYLTAIALSYDWAFIISPEAVILALGVSAATGIIFGYYPAKKAARLDPIEALRYE